MINGSNFQRGVWFVSFTCLFINFSWFFWKFLMKWNNFFSIWFGQIPEPQHDSAIIENWIFLMNIGKWHHKKNLRLDWVFFMHALKPVQGVCLQGNLMQLKPGFPFLDNRNCWLGCLLYEGSRASHEREMAVWTNNLGLDRVVLVHVEILAQSCACKEIQCSLNFLILCQDLHLEHFKNVCLDVRKFLSLK